MTAALFLGFLALMAIVVVVLVDRYLNKRIASGVAIGLVIWFIYAGLLGYLGVLKSTTTRPPGIALVFIPVLTFLIVFIVRFSVNLRVAAGLSTLDAAGHAMLSYRRRIVPASSFGSTAWFPKC